MDIPREPYGIQELYRPTEVPAEIDIVAVHGLNGHATKTWTSEQKGGICWLSHAEFLPRYIPRARVLVWGYNASISSLTGANPSSNTIMHHAQTLVSQLAANRELNEARGRPIIFVCHSLGGIVVKRALTHSASYTKLANAHSIFTCTFAILFFGTPHQGCDRASFVSSLQRIASFSIPKRVADFESGLVRALERESEVLENITDQFVPLMDNFRIYFFWEQEKTNLKYTRGYIVEQASAAPALDDTERCGVAADHRGMCRFSNPNSEAFRTTVAALKRYSREAPEVILPRVQRAERQRNARQMQPAEDGLAPGFMDEEARRKTNGSLEEHRSPYAENSRSVHPNDAISRSQWYISSLYLGYPGKIDVMWIFVAIPFAVLTLFLFR